MFKRVAGIVALIVVASLFVAGCTAELKPTVENQAGDVSTAYPKAGDRSELLRSIVALENRTVGDRWEGYKVTWINNTAVNVHGKTTGSAGASIYTFDNTYIQFPTVNAASAYFDAKRPEYTYKSLSPYYASTYSLATNQKNATVIKAVWHDGSDTTYRLEQYDALIIETTSLAQSINQA
jgi:hypothetical protein